ncbi:MAG: hypothetical protein ACRDJ9_23340 [Dehalococcoidia bacterium]
MNRNQEQVISRHITSEGVLVYVRSACGELKARLIRWDGGDRLVLQSPTRAP